MLLRLLNHTIYKTRVFINFEAIFGSLNTAYFGILNANFGCLNSTFLTIFPVGGIFAFRFPGFESYSYEGLVAAALLALLVLLYTTATALSCSVGYRKQLIRLLGILVFE